MGWDPFGTKAAKDIKRASREAAAAAKEAAEANAKAFRFNAAVYAKNADMVEQQALVDEAKQRRAGNQFQGVQEAAIAGSGFDANVGFDGIREQNEEALDLDAIIVRRTGQAKAADFRAQEQLAYMNADAAIAAGEAQARQAVLNGNIQANAAQNSAISGTINTGISAVVAFSDARIKENITWVGTLPTGDSLFEFNYVWDDRSVRRWGVMAQEVRARKPEAVSRGEDGILMVDYAKLGLPAGYQLAEAVRRGRASSQKGRPSRESVFA
jgi:hypothetical protein